MCPAGRGATIDGVQSFDAYEAAGWEQRAGAYAAFASSLTARIGQALLAAAAIVPGTRVVDVGCGPGHVAAASARRGGSVIGIDIAHEMVSLARSRYPDVEFRQGDAQALALPDASADAVLGNFVILHVGHPERAAAEFVRILAPGGVVALSTWDVPERCRFVGVFVDAVTAVGAEPPAGVPPGPGFFQFADDGAFASLLRAAGLAEVDVSTLSLDHVVADADQLWHGLLGATVRMRSLVLGQPEVNQERIRAAYDELVMPYQQPDGSVRIPVSVKIAVGSNG
jgi:SAM-dependent methyltransferase